MQNQINPTANVVDLYDYIYGKCRHLMTYVLHNLWSSSEKS